MKTELETPIKHQVAEWGMFGIGESLVLNINIKIVWEQVFTT